MNHARWANLSFGYTTPCVATIPNSGSARKRWNHAKNTLSLGYTTYVEVSSWFGAIYHARRSSHFRQVTYWLKLPTLVNPQKFKILECVNFILKRPLKKISHLMKNIVFTVAAIANRFPRSGQVETRGLNLHQKKNSSSSVTLFVAGSWQIQSCSHNLCRFLLIFFQRFLL